MGLYFLYVFPPSSHQGRTKAAPSLPKACIRLALFSRQVCSGSASVSRSTCGEYAGLLYKNHTEFGTVVPA
jgi:hypothetical protein